LCLLKILSQLYLQLTMPLFKIGQQLEHIKEISFKLEREIQRLTEQNLQPLLRLNFIRSEFSLNNFRIDTLAFDSETKAFIIIEYKRDRTFSVIDQGYAYLSLMLNNKADFILEYNESQNQSLKRTDVEWSQSKVIFISPLFTTYQREAINFKDLPIELWEVKKFENNTVSFEQIQKSSAKESIKTISRTNDTVETVNKEVRVYTEQDHLLKVDFETRELYEQFKERLLNMENTVTVQPKKQTLGFKVNNNIFCDVVLLGKGLKIYLNLKSSELQDQKNVSRDVSNVGHWGNGAYEIKLTDLEDIDYILSLLKQSLRKNKD
jgi:predicted transport protein